MRQWLNRHRCEPSKFTYDLSDDETFTIRLSFEKKEEAQAFNQYFNNTEGCGAGPV